MYKADDPASVLTPIKATTGLPFVMLADARQMKESSILLA
jgi:hypothetical protein